MASGYPGGGGGGEFYGGIRIPGRSMLQSGAVVSNNINPNPVPLPSPYRTTTNNHLQQHQLPQIFLDQTTPPPSSLSRNQIPHRLTQSMIGKRTLAEFQHHQIYQRQSNSMTPAALSNLLMLRSVKPRHMMTQSPISPLELSPNIDLVRWSQLRPNQAGPQMIATHQDPSFSMAKKLEELEKQLLEDDDEENESVLTSFDNNNGDNISVSEWSKPLNFIAPTAANPISQSPTTSSSSSSCSSVAPACTRQNLLEAASAISESRNDAALEILSRAAVQPPHNASPEIKLVGFLAGALKSRVNPAENPPPVSELYSRDHAESTRSLCELSPCFKLGFMAANLAIVDAAQGCEAIHVIDFDVGQGAGQYVNLLHALSSARGAASSLLKVTAVHDREEDDRLAEVAEMLTLVAERVGVQFRFKSVELGEFGGLTRASLGVDEDEALAVNFAFKLYRVTDESVSVENPRDELLRRVRGLSPLVVTLVEQDININTAPFLPRVGELCAYYGALLESMEATVTRESGERAKAEIGIARKLANAVSCEGRDRVERCEVFGKWRSRLVMAGFVSKPLGQSVAETMRNRVSSVNGRTNPGFTIKEEAGGVCFGWMEKTLTVASAWR